MIFFVLNENYMFSQLGTVAGTVRGLCGDCTGTVRGLLNKASRGILSYKFAYIFDFMHFAAVAGPCWRLSVAELCASVRTTSSGCRVLSLRLHWTARVWTRRRWCIVFGSRRGSENQFMETSCPSSRNRFCINATPFLQSPRDS